ncbi:competence protein CoiA family protein [Thioalkalivibrio versutus]|uniref:competence protein CoiA family protein n=1 Tax=Thioalkalivibrio versutus TaxID=106634 RepID=UPI000477553F|nr:competence protein CoiA family protein [Thioalkalivibrio versutus]OOC50808.1 hypothetical protein B0684_01820 [Thioalkalivibrio versutus]
MEKSTLLQSFARNNAGQIVSIHDVTKGKACGCSCPECGEVVIARQGQVRQWHFAHSSGADCGGTGESALHQAAKQILLQERWITLPPLERERTSLECEPSDSDGAWMPPEGVAHLHDPKPEVTLASGLIRADVVAEYAGQPILIEVAVSHFADPEKRQLLANLGHPAMEIHLAGDPNLEWSWELLRKQVLEDPLNRVWLYHPILEQMRENARKPAVPAETSDSKTKPDQEKWRWDGVPIVIRTYPWGITLWSAFDKDLNARLKETARNLGGRWKPRYTNWSFPSGVKTLLEETLREGGAQRE